MGYFDFETIDIYDFFLIKKENQISHFLQNDNEKIKNQIKNLDEIINKSFEKIKDNEIKKILICGYIQGGKTDFAIGLNSKIISKTNNHSKNIFIHLTSSNIKLMNQNFERFENFFKNDNIDNSNIFIQKNNKNFEEMFELKIKNNNNILLFFIKEMNNLKNIKKCINFVNNKFPNTNIYIFDDEGDNASFNTYDNTIEEQEKNSKIFSEISSFINIENVKYISITATPMIHLLTHNNSNLKPDYAFLLKKNYGYTGIEEFMDEFNKKDSKIFVPIYDEENDLLKSLILFLIKALFVEKGDIKLDSKSKPLMIINVSPKTEIHFETKSFIENRLDLFFNNIELLVEKIKEWNILNLLNNKLIQIINDNNITIEYIAKKIISSFKNKYNIVAFNSKEKNDEEIENFENSSSVLRIVIGAFKISRGVTFKNLLQAFISYKPETINIDNIMQQCRWFGYRKNYLKHITLFMNPDYYQIYNDVLNLEQDLYERIKSFENLNKKFSDMEKIFILSNNPYKKIKGTYQRRANQILDEGYSLTTYLIKNKFELIFYEKDKMEYLYKEWFQKFNITFDENNYQIIKFKTFNEFYESLKNYDEHLEFFFGKNINIFKDKLFDLNQKTIVRFINDNKKIIWKERICTFNNGSTIYWGNGTYKDFEKGIDLLDVNYIDLLPLSIHGYDEKNDEVKLFRFKLNINCKLTNEIAHLEKKNIIRINE